MGAESLGLAQLAHRVPGEGVKEGLKHGSLGSRREPGGDGRWVKGSAHTRISDLEEMREFMYVCKLPLAVR